MENGTNVYDPTHIRGQLVLAKQKLTRDELDRAIQLYAESENVTVATKIGIDDNGFYYSDRPDWSPDAPDAFSEPLGIVPWLHLQELLGKVPEGTTDDYFKNPGRSN